MLKIFKKAFWILCDDVVVRPGIPEIHGAIAKHCEENEHTCEFISDDEVAIAGILHEIRCVRSAFYRGHFVIKCREK